MPAGLKILALLSVLLCLLALPQFWLVLPVNLSYSVYLEELLFSGVLFLPWALLQLVAVWRYGKRGLWLLIAVPALGFTPLMVYLAVKACTQGNINACI